MECEAKLTIRLLHLGRQLQFSECVIQLLENWNLRVCAPSTRQRPIHERFEHAVAPSLRRASRPIVSSTGRVNHAASPGNGPLAVAPRVWQPGKGPNMGKCMPQRWRASCRGPAPCMPVRSSSLRPPILPQEAGCFVAARVAGPPWPPSPPFALRKHSERKRSIFIPVPPKFGPLFVVGRFTHPVTLLYW